MAVECCDRATYGCRCYSVNTGSQIGYVNTGSSITVGDRNTFVGTSSGNKNTVGTDNTFVGFRSGKKCS